MDGGAPRWRDKGGILSGGIPPAPTTDRTADGHPRSTERKKTGAGTERSDGGYPSVAGRAPTARVVYLILICRFNPVLPPSLELIVTTKRCGPAAAAGIGKPNPALSAFGKFG